MNEEKIISESLNNIFSGINTLRKTFKFRKFTIDGRLVGDLDEIIAALNYDIILDSKSHPDHDGKCSNGWKVQVKATFQDELTFKKIPDFYLGLKLFPDGRYEEIYNGPGNPIFDRYNYRKGIGEKLLRFPNEELKKLSLLIPDNNRIKRIPR